MNLVLTIYLTTLHILRRHLRQRKSWTIIGLFLCSFEISTKDEELDLRHSTGFLNYTSVLTNSVILLGLPNAPRNLFPNYYHVFFRWSKLGFIVTVTLATRGVVWIRCGFWRTLKICRSTYNLSPSHPAIALKHMTSLLSTQLFPTLSWKSD